MVMEAANDQKAGNPSAVPDNDLLLEVQGVSKAFGLIKANSDISFELRAGEIHALVGENGAGKSTLMKILYGIQKPDSGQIFFDGHPVTIASPAKARSLGLGMVFQDLRLIPALSVWENVALHAKMGGKILRPTQIKASIEEASLRYGLAVDPSAVVNDLSIGEWQRVELLKVLIAGARVLILDEPTSVLAPQEVESLFGILDRLRTSGVGVIIITHKLREVRAIADRVSVLRGGKAILTNVVTNQISDQDLIVAMIGESVTPITNAAQGANSEKVPHLIANDLALKTSGEGTGLRGIDLKVRSGEILGIAGIAGNGQRELADLVSGMLSPDAGEVIVAGIGLTKSGPAHFRKNGIQSVSADPLREFVIPGLTIAEHAALWLSALGSKLKFDISKAAKWLEEVSNGNGLSVAQGHRRLDRLSGGNIQRVLLTLAFSNQPSCLVVSYPTRGLDIRTAEVTHAMLMDARDNGTAIILISEDIDELISLSDRIAVLSNGKIAGVLDGAGAERVEVGSLMTEVVA